MSLRCCYISQYSAEPDIQMCIQKKLSGTVAFVPPSCRLCKALWPLACLGTLIGNLTSRRTNCH